MPTYTMYNVFTPTHEPTYHRLQVRLTYVLRRYSTAEGSTQKIASSIIFCTSFFIATGPDAGPLPPSSYLASFYHLASRENAFFFVRRLPPAQRPIIKRTYIRYSYTNVRIFTFVGVRSVHWAILFLLPIRLIFSLTRFSLFGVLLIYGRISTFGIEIVVRRRKI